MKYVRVLADNTLEVLLEKPKWYMPDGTQVTDEWLVENHSIYKLYERTVDPREFIEKPSTEWIIGSDYVEKTYFTVINIYEPIEKTLTQVHSIDPESEWVYDDDTVTIYHRVIDRNGEDLNIIVNNARYATVPFDPNNSIEKPMDYWRYENGIIYKSYWSIIRDPERENHIDLFYNHTTTDISGWDRTDTTIQEKLVFTPKSIEECKANLIEYISYYRWEIEVGGYNYNGNGIHTDRESQTKLTSIYTLLKNDVVTGDTNWKTMEGFIVLNPQNLEIMCLSIFSFIKNLYDKENEVVASVNSSTTINQIINIHNNLKSLMMISNSIFLENN